MSWFFRRRVYEGTSIDLKENHVIGTAMSNNFSIVYDICLHGANVVVGDCDLRFGMNDELYYAGNVGYNVRSDYRGHGYAYEACRILFQIAQDEHHQQSLIITCSPDNIPSRKTLEKLDGEYVETVPVPMSHWLYRRGEKVKNIYLYKLREEQ